MHVRGTIVGLVVGAIRNGHVEEKRDDKYSRWSPVLCANINKLHDQHVESRHVTFGTTPARYPFNIFMCIQTVYPYNIYI